MFITDRENYRQENQNVCSPIEGESSSQTTPIGNVHGKDLVTRIFYDPEALSMLRDAIFSEASTSSHSSSSNVGAFKARHTAPAISTPANKRPRGEEPLFQQVVVVDPEQVSQGSNEQKNLDVIDDEGDDEYSFSASRWQASDVLISSLGTIHKPLSAFERKALCRSHDQMLMQSIRLQVTFICLALYQALRQRIGKIIPAR